MLLLAAVIMVGNLLAAVAPGFWTFCAARFISGLPHGAYFGVGAIVARKLASPSKAASAVAIMIGGMTVATLVGVPAGTLISNVASWRLAYVVVGLSAAATFMAIRYWVPAVPGLEDMGFKGQFRFMRTLPPWLIFGGVLLGQIGIYSWYSFIDPQLTIVAGFSRDSMSWLMVLAGFGMFAGNLVAGRLGDRFKPAAVAASVQASAIPVLVLFSIWAITSSPPYCLWCSAPLRCSGRAVRSRAISWVMPAEARCSGRHAYRLLTMRAMRLPHGLEEGHQLYRQLHGACCGRAAAGGRRSSDADVPLLSLRAAQRCATGPLTRVVMANFNCARMFHPCARICQRKNALWSAENRLREKNWAFL